LAGRIARGDVRLYQFGAGQEETCGRLTRDSAIAYLSSVTVAPITSTIRDVPYEVALSEEDGMKSALCSKTAQYGHRFSEPTGPTGCAAEFLADGKNLRGFALLLRVRFESILRGCCPSRLDQVFSKHSRSQDKLTHGLHLLIVCNYLVLFDEMNVGLQVCKSQRIAKVAIEAVGSLQHHAASMAGLF
jgi:hypothetical protein